MGATVKVRDLSQIINLAEKKGERIICSCCGDRCCFCIRCTQACCNQCGIGFLSGLLPSCVTQHGVATSDIGTAIYVGASVERLNLAYKILYRARLDQQLSLAEMQYTDRESFTPAERSQLLEMIVKGTSDSCSPTVP